MTWLRRTLTAVAATANLACGDDPFSPAAGGVVGSYAATTLTTTTGGTSTDQLAAGASLTITINADGTTNGQLVVPTAGFDESLAGTWALNGDKGQFTQSADTFVRDMVYGGDFKPEVHMLEREQWTVAIARSLMIAAFLSALGARAFAQRGADSVTLAPACDDSAGPGATYTRCALWLEGRSLRRGTDATPIAKTGLFWPRLAPNFRGDSARSYGSAYDRNTQRAAVLGVASVVLAAAAFNVESRYHCRRDPTFGFCTNSDQSYVIASVSLLTAGIAAGVSSLYLVHRANRALGRALWWHNANFGR